MIQDVFISFWEKRDGFSNDIAIKTYLYTSVRNKCLNHLKHLAVQKKHEQQLIFELESDYFFKTNVIEEEAFNELYQEINNLPEGSRKVMLLALKGLKNHEIANTLNVSENTVKTQKKIAYSKLRSKLSPGLQAILLSL